MSDPTRFFDEYRPFAARIASGFARTLRPHVQPGEIHNAALVGLWEAARSYDEQRGAFVSFARSRIRGAILDWLRESLPLTRNELARRRINNRLEKNLSLQADEATDARSSVPPWSAQNCRDAVTIALRPLTPRLRLLVRLVYFESLSQKDVAQALGISPQAISQMMQTALETMHSRVKHRRDEFLATA